MKTLNQKIELIKELTRQKEIKAYRFYTSDCQACILDLIAKEIETWPTDEPLPENLHVALSNPEKYASDDITDLCLLYRRIIIYKTGIKKP